MGHGAVQTSACAGLARAILANKVALLLAICLLGALAKDANLRFDRDKLRQKINYDGGNFLCGLFW